MPTTARSTCGRNAASFCFAVERTGELLGEVALPLRGVHNVVNAVGTIAMAEAVGVPFDAAARALARFGGVARRFDIRGVDGGATFVDDYAHLPTEIAAVIAAARESGDGWRRVIVAFQPNRFNRIAEMWRDYADAFQAADVAVITDVYASGTVPIPGVTGELIVNAVLDAHPTRTCGLAAHGGPTWSRSSPARSGPATCASRWAAATWRRCPTKCSPGAPNGGRRERVASRPRGRRRDGPGGRQRARAEGDA